MLRPVTENGHTSEREVTAIYPATLTGTGAAARAEPSPFATPIPVDLAQYRAATGD